MPPPFSFAFQPIVDAVGRQVYSYEALIRGVHGESAWSILGPLSPDERRAIDVHGHETLFTLAVSLGLPCHLNINMTPQGLAGAATVGQIIHTATCQGLTPSQLVIEVTENEGVADPARFKEAVDALRGEGLKLALDDFGAGYAGLNLLADFQPDLIKLDIELVRKIERRGPRQAIVRAILSVCVDLGIDVIAEGVESVAEYDWFRAHDVSLFQGYLFAKPGFEMLPTALFPGPSVALSAPTFDAPPPL